MTAGMAETILDRFNVSRETGHKIEVYVDLLLTWQRRINLIGPATAPVVWQRHVCDALQLIPLLPAGTREIADLGTGAGIPGLVVAMASGLEAHLYESNGKKAAFLREAARRTGTGVHIHVMRLEAVAKAKDVPKVQCVMARALAPLSTLLGYGEPFLSQGAVGLFHKGQDVDSELTEATKCWKIEFVKHQSQCDPRGVILEVREANRV